MTVTKCFEISLNNLPKVKVNFFPEGGVKIDSSVPLKEFEILTIINYLHDEGFLESQSPAN